LGANLAKRKVRVTGKRDSEFKPSADYRAKAREARQARAKAEADEKEGIKNATGDDEAVKREAKVSDNMDALLRGSHTEELLVGMFGQPAYFTILALAYKWPRAPLPPPLAPPPSDIVFQRHFPHRFPPYLACRARWLSQCRQVVDSLAPKVAAASLLMVAVNFEGLTPMTKRGTRPTSLLAALSNDFKCERKHIVAGMSMLCNAYSVD
jgi:hypothetical protein